METKIEEHRKTIKKRPDQIEKIQRAQWQRIFIRVGWTALLVVVFVSIYLFIRPDPERQKPAVTGSTKQEIMLEQLLESGTTQEIIKKAKEMKVSSSVPLLLRLQRINIRMKIAECLLKKHDDAVAQKNGTLFKIESLHQLAKLSNSKSLGVTDAAEELNALVTESLGSPDPEIAKVARVSITLNAVQDFLDDGTDENRDNAVNKCRQLAEDLPEDREVATAIFQIAKLMKYAQGYTMHSVDFFNIVFEVYTRSEILLTKQIGFRSYEEIVFGDNKLAELKESAITHRGNAAADISKRLEFGLNNPDLRSDEAVQLFSILDVLVQSGEIELAQVNIEHFSNFLTKYSENENLRLIQTFLDDAKKQIKNFGQPLNFGAFVSIDGQSAIEPTSDTGARLLVFWSPDNSNSRKILVELNRLPPKLRDRTQVIAICRTDERNSEEEILLVRELADQLPAFNFATIQTNSTADKTFKDGFPITKMPFLILLDRDNVVRGINPSMLTIRSQLRVILE